MKLYELLYIIPATETPGPIQERVKTILAAQNVEVVRHAEAGRIRPAYPLGGARQGIYFLAIFRGDSKSAQAIEAALRLERSVVRAVIRATSEKAIARPVNLITYQEPLVDRETSSDSRSDTRRFTARPAPRRAPVPAPTSAAPAAAPLSESEIEKQIDKILEEKAV